MKSLFKLNAFGFLLFLILQISNSWDSFFLLRFFRSVFELFAILVLFGINLTALLQIIFKIKLDRLEKINLAAVASFVLAPMLLAIEFSVFKKPVTFFPIANSLLLFILLFIIWHYKKNELAEDYQIDLNLKFSRFSSFKDILNFLPTPLFWGLFLLLATVFTITNAYYPLPDLDPYSWIRMYREAFGEKYISSIFWNRPLFFSLSNIFIQASSIDMYAYFKYVIPFLSVLILLPTALVAREFKNNLHRFIIFLFPFSSASLMLYLETAMPQAILILLTYYYFFFLAYSWLSGKKIFFYSGGLLIFLAFFYHETAAIIFLPWIIVTILTNRKKLTSWITENKVSAILILAVLFSNFNQIAKPFLFIFNWLLKMSRGSFFETNFLFPLEYTNIDGNAMGWNSTLGVVKYYLFYVGPVAMLAVGFFLYLLHKDSFRQYFKKIFFLANEVRIFIFSFLLFFSISEILPRLSGISLLPERAWVFGGIFSLGFILLLLHFEMKNKTIAYIFIIAFLINILGAVYVNDSKRHTITRSNLASAEWIKSNLPENRVFFAFGDINLLSFHAQSETISVNQKFYENIETYENFSRSAKKIQMEDYEKYLKILKEKRSDLDYLKQKDWQDEAPKIIEEIINQSTWIKNGILDQKDETINYYIYHARPNKNNPYLSRPYYNPILIDSFIFDRYPEKFKRIYSDKKNNIIIWKIL